MKVSPAKYAEIIFVDEIRKSAAQLPSTMPNIARVTSMKVFGVTLTNSLSVAEHVQAAISSCAQTLYALRILRAHGMDDTNLRTVYQSVSISVLFFSQPFCQW